MINNFETIIAVLSKESLRAAFDACTSEADAVKLLAENGVTVTEAQLRAVLMKATGCAQENGSNELSEKQLEQIAGGGFWGDLWEDCKKCLRIMFKDGHIGHVWRIQPESRILRAGQSRRCRPATELWAGSRPVPPQRKNTVALRAALW